MKLDIRVLARPEGFDRTKIARLSVKVSMRLDDCLADDTEKRLDALEARSTALGLSSGPASNLDREDASHIPVPDDQLAEDNDGVVEGDAHSFRTLSSDYSSASSNLDESGSMLDGFFGDPHQNVEILPLVHLWVDMAAEVKQEDIADPRELFKERDAIVR